MSETITTPVGRLVEGSLYKGNTHDMEGKPLVFKTGKNAGQPRTEFYFALAIPKGKESHWNQTTWGQIIDRVAKASFPQGQHARPDFSWKITDGDSTQLNRAPVPRRFCDKEGYPGNWVLKFTHPSSAARVYNRDGSKLLTEENYVNLGDYIEVHSLVDGNKSVPQPGVYLNPLMIAFSAYGPRIIIVAEQDPKAVGFGNAPLPAGASATPLSAFVPPVDMGREVPELIPPAAPYPQILNVPSAPVAPPARVMLPTAMATYEQYKASGWTDQQLIDGGFMSA